MSDEIEPRPPRKGVRRLIGRTFGKAWEGNIFSESAEAAFWQTLSLPPLLLGLLGSLGFMGDWFGPGFVTTVHDKIITFCERVFTGNVVHQIIEPTVDDILTIGKGEIVSVGFLISLWAGSSAMSSFVDAITVAHDQYGVRNEVWQRIFALLLYLCGLVLLVIGLPVIAVGPNILTDFFPDSWRPTVSTWIGIGYYPVLAVGLIIALATLYKLALPRRLPWHRGLPGATLAMVIFLLASIGLRIYLTWITSTGYTYGALATPIAFLLFTYFIGMAVVGGAYFNSAIQELWPAKMTRRQRRRWRRLEMEKASEKMRSEQQGKGLWERTTTPLRKPRAKESGEAAGDLTDADQASGPGRSPS
ncbi:YihY/virulence factor BrkB family protein [Amycolatopsis sp.]|uniref:YihY/virulence factor BrkB family protein n=1 Tax=Amycolatopsis sp. TaxID=37632 RepID=UPI002BDC3425|nr:YihY/virulence factor BrkB family protein [Amycolatopsis sp.]HVV10073.1 YihY/virulence factor BrkB family protein [Amycolatopsis sp.]